MIGLISWALVLFENDSGAAEVSKENAGVDVAGFTAGEMTSFFWNVKELGCMDVTVGAGTTRAAIGVCCWKLNGNALTSSDFWGESATVDCFSGEGTIGTNGAVGGGEALRQM